MKTKFFEKPENIFLCLASIFIGVMVFVMPINRVPDESNHARMTWQLVYNQKNSFDWYHSVSNDKKLDKPEYKLIFTKKIDFSKEKFNPKINLKNIVHFPQLLGMLIGKMVYPSVGVMFILGRICNALLYIVGMYFVIKKAAFGKYALLFISLLPIMLQQAASLSYDVANYLAITLFFAFSSNLAVSKVLNLKYFIGLLATTIALYITKTNNLLTLLALPFLDIYLPERFSKINEDIEKIKLWLKKRKYYVISSTVILLLAVATLYFRSKGGITHFIQIMINSLINSDLNGHINSILSVGMFGYMGNFHFELPMWLIFIDILCLFILFMEKNDFVLSKEYGVFSSTILPLQIVAIVGGMYFAWTPLVLGENAVISVGAQGRYFTPFLIFLTPLFISFKDKFSITISSSFIRKLAVGVCWLNFVIMIYLVVLVYWYPDMETDWLIKLREMVN